MREESELTLGQFFFVVKKSLLRALIYILVSCIVVGGILVGIKFATQNGSYSSEIYLDKTNEYTEEYIKELKDTVASNVAISFGKPELAEPIKKNLTVSPIPVKEDFPTNYTILLKADNSFGLNKDEYVKLTEEISKEYINLFEGFIVADFEIEDISLVKEYMEKAILISKYYDCYYQYFLLTKGVNPKLDIFVDSNQNTLDSLTEKLLAEIENLRMIKYNIANSATTYSGDVTDLKKYLDLTGSKASYDASNANMKLERVANIYSYNYYKSLSQANATIAGNINEYITYISNPKGEYKDVEKDLDAAVDKLNVLKTKIKDFEEEANGRKYDFTNSKIKIKAQVNPQATISTKLIVAILVAVAVIAFIVAYCQTYFALKKKGELKNNNETEN